MSERLRQVLDGSEDNYLLPFLWQRGESEEVIRTELARIYDSGIRAVCIESRPHPDILGPGWWRDVDMIMEEARSRGMKVWVFDDDHFPTGHAAGRVKDAPASLRRRYLAERHLDAIGPANGASFLLNTLLQPEETLIVAVAMTREPSGRLGGGAVELTGHIEDGVLYWDVPPGLWRLCLVIDTPHGGNEARQDYINPLVGESTQLLIDAVYESYYKRYKADFGRAFAGFFSDEPGFYNDKEMYDFNSATGKVGVELPWRGDMLELLEREYGSPIKTLLPLLWLEGGEETAAVRYVYMNVVSSLYAEHFSGRIGRWCRERGVDYIGHVIEDNNAHARLGCGAGHFFRALWGQHMAGIDVVLHQLLPGFDETPHVWIAGETDSEFYHYGLAKLGSSLAHIDPKKQGRALCEVFGAYGWSEGLKLMKWITDHMLVRGINYFVPHAFSQKEFPDQDCPPHFYARGHNPQYRYYKLLNHYTNRVSHLLSGGRHVATVAVLYHAEAEWAGEAMPFQKPVRELLQAQLDCDVLPCDVLREAQLEQGRLEVAQESYECLIIPWCHRLPVAVAERIVELAEQGLPVLFVDALPKELLEVPGTARGVESLRSRLSTSAEIVPLSELATRVRQRGMGDVEAADRVPYLRSYHYVHPDMEVYMFFNEHPYEELRTRMRLHAAGELAVYRPFENELHEAAVQRLDGGALELELALCPYESLIVVNGTQLDKLPLRAALPDRDGSVQIPLTGLWRISIADAGAYPVFTFYEQTEQLGNLNARGKLPDFSGTMRYELEFDWEDATVSGCALELGEVYETAEVWLNEVPLGAAICSPYRYAAAHALRVGRNKLVIDVTNTLVKQQKDFLSRFMQQEPGGLLGPVSICTAKAGGTDGSMHGY